MVRGRFGGIALVIALIISAVAVQSTFAQSRLVKPGAGFPIKITKAGSYILNSTLIVGVTLADAIKVSHNNVSINLNGFSIIGPATGTGIGVDAVGMTNVTVSNGSVTGMGGAGISLGDNGTVQNVRIIANGAGGSGGDGVDCGVGCLVSGSVISNNLGGNGLTFPDASSGYLNNIINGNKATVVGGTPMSGNICNAITTCP